MPSSDDRRGDPREELTLLIEVDGRFALTRDISPRGVYFHSTTIFDAGSEIEFRLPLPNLEDTDLELDCRGTIIRVDGLDGGCGVAARIDHSSLRARVRAAMSH